MFLSFEIFERFPELVCGFSTRNGGFSRDSYASLNMGMHTGDDKITVETNRDIFYKKLNISKEQVALPGQIHSSTVKFIDSPGIYENCDALITDNPGIFIAIQTADCFPVFLYSPNSSTVAIIHAGWRGVQGGIVQNTLRQLESGLSVKMNEVFAVIGPGLQHECFEVQNDVYELFPKNYLKKHPVEFKRYLDLGQFVFDLFCIGGIKKNKIFRSSTCTKCDASNYYSFRRDGSRSGRMMGIIGINR